MNFLRELLAKFFFSNQLKGGNEPLEVLISKLELLRVERSQIFQKRNDLAFKLVDLGD